MELTSFVSIQALLLLLLKHLMLLVEHLLLVLETHVERDFVSLAAKIASWCNKSSFIICTHLVIKDVLILLLICWCFTNGYDISWVFKIITDIITLHQFGLFLDCSTCWIYCNQCWCNIDRLFLSFGISIFDNLFLLGWQTNRLDLNCSIDY